MTEPRAAIVEWLRTEFAAEQRAGFPVMGRVPDTQVVRFLDHFAGLDEAGQSALTATLFEWSAHSFLDAPPPNPVWRRFQQATAFPELRGGRRYTGVKLLARLAKEHGDAEALVPVGIPALRRKVDAAFSGLFAPRVTDLGSETWRYEGALEGCRIRVDVRYSGRLGWPQLAYGAHVRGRGRHIVRPNLCFESVFGVGFGQWDYLTKDNADRSVELLGELVGWLARLPERLPPGCCEMPTG